MPESLDPFLCFINTPQPLRILKDKNLSWSFSELESPLCQVLLVVTNQESKHWYSRASKKTTRWCSIFTFHQHENPEGNLVLHKGRPADSCPSSSFSRPALLTDDPVRSKWVYYVFALLNLEASFLIFLCWCCGESLNVFTCKSWDELWSCHLHLHA